MQQASAQQTVPECPGCHFGCRIDRYQCARGKGFLERWQAGEEIPERRGPGPGRRGAKHGASGDDSRKGPLPTLSTDARLAHVLGLAALMLKRADKTTPTQRVAEAALRHDGYATEYVVGERAQLSDDQLAQALADARESQLVELKPDGSGREFIHVTPTGREQAAQWDAQRKAAQADLLRGLDDDEKEQLLELLGKILQNARRKDNGAK